MVISHNIAKKEKVEETINRIKGHKDVKDVLILDKEGFAIKSTLNAEDTILYTKKLANFIDYANKELSLMDIKVYFS